MYRISSISVFVLIALMIMGFNTIKNPDGSSARWSDESLPIEYYINPNGSGLNETEVIGALRAAFEEWSKPDCTYIRTQYAGKTLSRNASPSDFTNILFFITDRWPEELGGYGTIAVCTPAVYSDGFIKDADIRFNAVDFKWSTKGEPDKMDLQNIATHEIGHFLGLDHTMVFGATMYPYSGYGETKARTLEEDDINGICFLYPARDAPSKGSFGSFCEYNSDCKSNICVSVQDSGICSQVCSLSEAGSCPSGYKCYEATDNNYYCFPGDNTSDLCKPCESSEECSSELCITDGNISICSRYCVPSSSNCPSGYYCAELENGGGGCWPENDECNLEEIPKDLGEICYTLNECRSGLICVAEKAGDDKGKCYYECNPDSPQCPEGNRCVTLNNRSGACMPGSISIDAGIVDSSERYDAGMITDSNSPSQSDGGAVDDIDLFDDLKDITGCECSLIF